MSCHSGPIVRPLKAEVSSGVGRPAFDDVTIAPPYTPHTVTASGRGDMKSTVLLQRFRFFFFCGDDLHQGRRILPRIFFFLAIFGGL